MQNIAPFFNWLSSIAGALERFAGKTSGDFTLAVIVILSLAVTAICVVTIFMERVRFSAFRRQIEGSVARAQIAILLREAIIAAGGEAVAVLGTHLNDPLSFGGGGALLQACLMGPDSATLASALDGLLKHANAFTQSVRTRTGQCVNLRGRPIGGHAAVFLSREQEMEHREIFKQFVNRLHVPIAIFNSGQRLEFCNLAYSRLWGLSETWLNTKPSQSEILDRLREARLLPERRDFPAWKREHLQLFANPEPRGDELWHLPGGKSLRMTARQYPGGGIIFLFDDVTEKLRLESACNSLTKVQLATLNTMQDGVAIFGTDCLLKMHNTNFANQWGLSESELANAHVTEIARRCEQRFASNALWDIVAGSINASDPRKYNEWATVTRADGTTVSLSLTRLPDGATMATFCDLTDLMRFEAASRDAAA